tara:strand:- start:74 stop:616 length:543 start_codon:yes stop_codon:yes gene_type:complete
LEKKKAYPKKGRAKRNADDAFASAAAENVPVKDLAVQFQLTEPSTRQKKQNLSKKIEQEVRAKLGSIASKGLDNLVHLAFRADSEQVRFVATKDLLDRAGFKPQDKTKVEIEDKRNRTPQEIEDEMRERFGHDTAELIMSKTKIIPVNVESGNTAGTDTSRSGEGSLASSGSVPAPETLN